MLSMDITFPLTHLHRCPFVTFFRRKNANFLYLHSSSPLSYNNHNDDSINTTTYLLAAADRYPGFDSGH